MFRFLKEKLKRTIDKISEKIAAKGEEETAEEIIEKPAEEIFKEYQRAKISKTKQLPKGIQLEEKTEEQLKKEARQELELKIKLRQQQEEEYIQEEEHFKRGSILSKFKSVFKKKPREEKPSEAVEEKPAEEEKLTAEELIEEATEESVQETEEITEKEEISGLGYAERVQKDNLNQKKEEQPMIEEEKVETQIEEEQPEALAEEPEKKGVFYKIKQKITTKKINDAQFDEIFYDMEIALMENNVAVEVIEKIKFDLKENLVDKPLKRNQISIIIEKTLKNSIKDLFDVEQFNLLEKAREKKPYIICFVGINGSGKTTTIAKIAKLLLNNNLRCVIAASDTFRSASIEQLQQHADNLGIKLIKHDYGADPAAVAYDAIEHAKAKAIDVVLIDTAGRMHSTENLMDEMEKIVRVSKPDLKIFVGEAITGNDCVEQAKEFNDSIGIDAIILAKADIDEKGGAAVSVSYITGKPIIYLGVGQNYEDLEKFNSDIILNNLGLEA